MYEGNSTVSIHESDLSRRWCGASRPGHFDGVCTVVAKLFLLARPNTALFGEKDFQQLAVIQRLTRDLDFPVEIVGCPTVREADGLAMSSRNIYLSEEERAAAPILHQTLRNVANDIYRGNFPSPEAAREAIIERISSETLARIDYVDVVDSDSLEPLDSFDNHLPRLLAAVFFGNIRLIDNVGVSAGIR
jgi:pantoate--beta-alanine ligase